MLAGHPSTPLPPWHHLEAAALCNPFSLALFVSLSLQTTATRSSSLTRRHKLRWGRKVTLASRSSTSMETGRNAIKIDHTDVVIIGNGPSGITLSYLLSGWWPYYNPQPSQHPNTSLHEKLCDHMNKSLVEQDLEYLSAGLEGRSLNPVALLFDTLTHPDADLGYEKRTRLSWLRQGQERRVEHMVLGKGRVGGAWQNIDGNILTLSLGSWMELPNLCFKDWLQKKRSSIVDNGVGAKARAHVDRATAEDVGQYYVDYVEQMGLRDHFRDGYEVTSVRKIDHGPYMSPSPPEDSDSGEGDVCGTCRGQESEHMWEVRGYSYPEPGHPRPFCIHCHHLVLAVGSYDVPNKLRVPGERLPFVYHSISDFEQILSSAPPNTSTPTDTSDRLVIIGAGLSAADAVVVAGQHNIPVTHVLRRARCDPKIIVNTLPRAIYPEYHRVREMMGGKHRCADGGEAEVDTCELTPHGCHRYQVYERSSIQAILDNHKVVLSSPTMTTVLPPCRAVLVLIGSRPNLSFLPQDGRPLAQDEEQAVSKDNLLEVDVWSYESTKEANLYAMGPLVGDNFVRFGRGAALAITRHLHNLHRKGSCGGTGV